MERPSPASTLSPKYFFRQLLGTVAVSLGSLLWGCSIAWPAVALPQMRRAANSSHLPLHSSNSSHLPLHSSTSCSLPTSSYTPYTPSPGRNMYNSGPDLWSMVAAPSPENVSSPACPPSPWPGGLAIHDDTSASWVGSSMPVGGLLGALVTGYLLDTCGRRPLLLLLYLLSALGWAIVSWAPSLAVLCIGRGLTGFCSAAFGLSGPVFIGEVASPQVRGSLCSFVSILVSVGLLYIMVAGSLLQPWLSALLCVPWAAAGFLLLLLVPESPAQLARSGQYERARTAAAWYHGSQESLREGPKQETSVLGPASGPGSWDSLEHGPGPGSTGPWDAYSRKMLAVVVVLMAASRMSGIPVVSYYLVDVLSSSSPGTDENLAAIVCGVTELLGGLVSLLLTDAVGRRPLLLASYVTMAAAMLLLALILHLPHLLPSFLPVLSINLFYLGFAIGCAPISGVLLGEVFTMETKGLATTVSVTVLWAGSFLVSKLFFTAEAVLGRPSTFGLFGLSNVLAALFVFCCLPETRRKTLAEIQEEFWGRREAGEGTVAAGPGTGKNQDASENDLL